MNSLVPLHSEHGASIAERWMACPGSVSLSRGMPNYETEHSKAGTAAHDVGANALLGKVEPAEWLGHTLQGIEITDYIVQAVTVYTDYCRELMTESDNYVIERQFNLAPLSPPAPMYGTTDFAIYKPKIKELEIVDYKNGSGVIVQVRGNKQLRYYALGAALHFEGCDIETVKITIVQPNAAHPDGVVRSESMDYLDLLAFSGELLQAARVTLQPDAPLVPGSHCRFCPASAVCPAQRDQAQSLAQVAFADMSPVNAPPAPETLPIALLAEIVDKADIMEAWLNAARAHARNLLESGFATEEELGLKMVEGKKGNRKWKDEFAASQMLQQAGLAVDDLFSEPELKSPAQVEKLLKKADKKIIAALVEQKPGNLQMVRSKDPRPAIALQPGQVFLALPSGD